MEFDEDSTIRDVKPHTSALLRVFPQDWTEIEINRSFKLGPKLPEPHRHQPLVYTEPLKSMITSAGLPPLLGRLTLPEVSASTDQGAPGQVGLDSSHLKISVQVGNQLETPLDLQPTTILLPANLGSKRLVQFSRPSKLTTSLFQDQISAIALEKRIPKVITRYSGNAAISAIGDVVLPGESYHEEEVPTSHKRALALRNRQRWQAAMNACHRMHADRKVMHEVSGWFPTIRTKWVFSVRRKIPVPGEVPGRIVIFRARLVAQGQTMVLGRAYSATYSPTVSPVSIFLLLTIAANYDLDIRTYDAKNAYYQSDLTDVVHLAPIEGFPFTNASSRAWRLDKALPGCKQSGLEFYKRQCSILTAAGYKICFYDPCTAILAKILPHGEYF